MLKKKTGYVEELNISLKKTYTDGQKSHEKMLNITNY